MHLDSCGETQWESTALPEELQINGKSPATESYMMGILDLADRYQTNHQIGSAGRNPCWKRQLKMVAGFLELDNY